MTDPLRDLDALDRLLAFGNGMRVFNFPPPRQVLRGRSFSDRDFPVSTPPLLVERIARVAGRVER